MKKEKSKKLNKSERGITLIALIITITIMIILIAVSIQALAGDNLIDVAGGAATNYKTAETKEQEMFKSMSVIMDSISIAGLSEENVTVTKTPEDWTNGIVKTAIQTNVEGYTLEYSKDLTTWYTYTEEIESSENETIYARLTDGNGIGGYIEIPITNIDKSAPVIESLTPTGDKASSDNEWYTSDVEITVKANDNGGGKLAGYEYEVLDYNDNTKVIKAIDGVHDIAETISIKTDGEYLINVKAVDEAGNRSGTEPITIKKDSVKPNLSIKVTPGKTSYAISATGTDNIGVAGYRFSKDNGSNWSGWQTSSSYTFSEIYGDLAGVKSTIKVEVKDKAGLTASQSTTSTTTCKNTTYYVDTANTTLCTLNSRKYTKSYAR